MNDWRATYPQDPRNDSLLDVPLEARNRQQIAFLAPHLSEQLLASQPRNELNSTLNLPLQQLLERLISGFIAERRGTGVENATAILIDSRVPERQGTGGLGGLLIHSHPWPGQWRAGAAFAGVDAQTVPLWISAGPGGDPPHEHPQGFTQ